MYNLTGSRLLLESLRHVPNPGGPIPNDSSRRMDNDCSKQSPDLPVCRRGCKAGRVSHSSRLTVRSEKPFEKYYFGNFWPSSPDPRQDLANSPTLRWEKGRQSFSSPSPWGAMHYPHLFGVEAGHRSKRCPEGVSTRATGLSHRVRHRLYAQENRRAVQSTG